MNDARDPDDIRPLLEELQETLSALQEELDGGGRAPRRPPSPAEFFRFTEEYTIPTLVALLETTIRSLELLGGVIRLLDPDQPLSRESPSTPERVTRGATTALSELRRALSEVDLSSEDLPPDGEARDVLEDARRLSAELERQLADAGATGGRTRGHGPVSIDVREDGDDAGSAGNDGDGETSVDVESELASIREEVHDEEQNRETDSTDGTADRSDEV
jgi:hypothetical protein